MSKLTDTPTKRKPGRPPTFIEPTKVVSVIMPLSMVKRLEREGDNISKTVREIIKEYDSIVDTLFKLEVSDERQSAP